MADPTPPPAGRLADFSGNWSMDLPACDSLEEVLRPFGVPWVLRKLLDNLTVRPSQTYPHKHTHDQTHRHTHRSTG